MFFPQGANINTNRSNGTKPNQEIEKNFTKFKVSQPFFKNNPIQVKPRIFYSI